MVVLTINYMPNQRDWIPGFMKNGRYTFPVLQAPTDDWMSNMKFGATNLVVDRQGHVVFKPAPHDMETMETVENELEMLLAQPAAK